jgi:hypothetical protein
MPDSIPDDRDAWLREIHLAFDAAEGIASAQGLDPEDEDHEWWLCIEEEAVRAARVARGIDEPLADPDASMDEITDLTVELRRSAPGDPEDHHLNEVQHLLLYYVAAHIHASLIDRTAGADVVRACWDAALPEGGDDDDDGEEPPWPVARPAPVGAEAWLAEMKAAWAMERRPPPVRTADGRPWLAKLGDRFEVVVALVLHQRGGQPPREAIIDLVDLLREMEREIAGEDPALANVAKHRQATFALLYLWTHLLMGHADEAQAEAVIEVFSQRMDAFGS